jgi:hypothetical protein
MFRQAYTFVDHERVKTPKDEGALVAWRKEERQKVSKVRVYVCEVLLGLILLM